jgi:hypothetical protein
MPKIYEYFGIIIRFFSNEHEPIHVHAFYGESIIKISFYIKDCKVTKIIYSEITGKFPDTKLKELKKFISIYKIQIVESWDKYFIWKSKVKFQRITKKL